MKRSTERGILTLVILGETYLLWRIVKKKQKPRSSLPEHPSKHFQNWDRVDEASWESFPASDPPGHY